jgi:hypothetical protein
MHSMWPTALESSKITTTYYLYSVSHIPKTLKSAIHKFHVQFVS